jgi:hypothetical protein
MDDVDDKDDDEDEEEEEEIKVGERPARMQRRRRLEEWSGFLFSLLAHPRPGKPMTVREGAIVEKSR